MRWFGAFVALVAIHTFSFVSHAEHGPKRHSPPSAPAAPIRPTNVRARVGTDLASRLIRSVDPQERIRGIQRAAAIGTPEAISLLVDSLERTPQIKADARALVAMARGLSRFADRERARAGLLAILGAGNPGLTGALPTARNSSTPDALEDGDSVARADLARQVAASSLARSGGDRAREALYGVARGGGSGQKAAILALAMHPPREPGFFGTTGASMPAAVVRLLGQLGDLRALDVLHAAARSGDVGVRCAALVSLAQLGDERAVPLARTAIAENDVRLRAASGEAFILLAAPERFKATAAILADDATTTIGIHMAERVYSPEITSLVALRAWEHPDRELRANAIRALGRSPDPNAAKALTAPQLLGERNLAYHAIHALARSPAPNAGSLIEGLLSTRLSTLAARAYVVRALVRGERTNSSDEAVFRLSRSHSRAERALGVFARVALGDADPEAFLQERDAQIRRAAVMASMARPRSTSLERAFLMRLTKEDDPVTRQVLAIGLAGGDPEGIVKTSTLIDRAESAGGDAPLAAFALARRADETTLQKVSELLGSENTVVRAHAARGLSSAPLPDASGRLAHLYAYETDIEVRRAAVAALAARTKDAEAPARKETLEIAAELDPDGPVRQAARRTLAGSTSPLAEPAMQEVAWVRMTLDNGQPLGGALAGSIVRSDGIAVPVAFDDEGFALVPGLPPGSARLVLEPKLPAYKEADRP